MGGDSRYIYGMWLMKMSADAIREKGPLGVLTSSVQLSVGPRKSRVALFNFKRRNPRFCKFTKRWLDRKRPDRKSEVFSLSHFLAFSPMGDGGHIAPRSIIPKFLPRKMSKGDPI